MALERCVTSVAYDFTLVLQGIYVKAFTNGRMPGRPENFLGTGVRGSRRCGSKPGIGLSRWRVPLG
jgi:hypothetical protein